MSREHIFLNSIFYFILTLFFIYIFVKEKKIVKKIDEIRGKFETKIIKKFSWENTTKEKKFRKISKFVESLCSALVLVLIIQKFYLGNFVVPTGSMMNTIMPGDRLFGNMFIYEFKKPKRGDIVVFKEPMTNKDLYTKRLMGLPGEIVQIKYDQLFVNGEKVSDREYTPLGEIGYKEWVVPKKGDEIIIEPGMNYRDEYKENIQVAEVQKKLKTDAEEVRNLLPDVKFYVNGKETGMIADYISDENITKKLINGETVKVILDEDCYMMLGDNTNNSYDSRMWGFVKENRIKGKALIRFWPLNRIGLLK